MNMTDPIADMITRIRNGVRARLPKIDVPASRLKIEIARDSYTVFVEPKVVVEVAFGDIQISPRYPAGLALRFARPVPWKELLSDPAAERFLAVNTFEGVRWFSREALELLAAGLDARRRLHVCPGDRRTQQRGHSSRYRIRHHRLLDLREIAVLVEHVARRADADQGQHRHHETRNRGTEETVDGVEVGHEMRGNAACAHRLEFRQCDARQPGKHAHPDAVHHVLGQQRKRPPLPYIEQDRRQPECNRQRLESATI